MNSVIRLVLAVVLVFCCAPASSLATSLLEKPAADEQGISGTVHDERRTGIVQPSSLKPDNA
jgi:hypothetical protein